MKITNKKKLALLISFCPTSWLRIKLYEVLLGYNFGSGTVVGWGVLIAVNKFFCGKNVVISRNNYFSGPVEVTLGDKTFIGKFNKIECGNSVDDPKLSHMNYARKFSTGNNSLINEGHIFDVLGEIKIGAGSWIAGFNSQFLTHGAGTMNRNIQIGEDCFVGSAVRFTPGSGVGNRVIVAMGSVVTRRNTQDNIVLGGIPAKLLKVREIENDFNFEKNW